MSFNPSTDQTEPSFTAPSSGGGHSAGSALGSSTSSQGTSRDNLGSITALGDRDYEAELTTRWAALNGHEFKQRLVSQFFDLTFGVEEFRPLFEDSVLVWYNERTRDSDNLQEMIYRFKAFQHQINQMTNHRGFDQRDGTVFNSWALPDGVPRDYEYINHRHPERGPMTLDQASKASCEVSIADSQQSISTTVDTDKMVEATFIPKGYDRSKDYKAGFVEEWNKCRHEHNNDYFNLVKKYFEWTLVWDRVYYRETIGAIVLDPRTRFVPEGYDRYKNYRTEFMKEWDGCKSQNNDEYKTLVDKYMRWTVVWTERYFRLATSPIVPGLEDRDTQLQTVLRNLTAIEAQQHEDGKLATSTWQVFEDDELE
ncbi:hypothetical protein HD553DRAFT_322976 [Filobasidium floriforme]|uniref:uncharacterized protein n=1 Tax=Filobasidium floriforme TaxID=5210 RepID=UPI001E8D1274|nr:uncharacterized protein HD553DRAFT_322976 [Filobasidium floriforme]KAH8087503.1 hypothetical protein HD553DRAFT_322976 [Filobasidium floriforme]